MQTLADLHVFVDPDALVVLGLLGSCDFLSCRADAVPQGRTVIAEREVPDVRGIERKRLGTRAIGGGAPDIDPAVQPGAVRSEEHTSELHSLMRYPYTVNCLQKQTNPKSEHP